MRLELVSFTQRGAELAETLARDFPGSRHTAAHGAEGFSLDGWTREAFGRADALVFIGAAGIAVRAVAPYVRSKADDPAVVVVDEGARFAVPLLSGHLGGANELARALARRCGALLVLTTATDVRGVFAVDSWARRQGMAVTDTGKIGAVSAKLLSGQPVYYKSDWPVAGTPPEQVLPAQGRQPDWVVSIRDDETQALQLVPRIAVLGVGCKKGTPLEAFEECFYAVFAGSGVCARAVTLVCSIDLKAREPGLLDFCQARGLPFETFSPEELRQAGEGFSSSAFVESVTGVGNVCERSAVAGSYGGDLLIPKIVGRGVTMALALRPFSPDWRWQDE